ncbi:MAG: tRNA (adenosine(37)-N6)-threonylcarbamoyltransferase complex dimerization subunit type 1 TsaB [Flavobacteriaceae bacterium]
MAIILNLETATTNCSVSISRKGQLLALIEENSASYSHSEQLHKFIEQGLEKAGLTIDQLDAVAVSKGPGSYTGLRIGVSTAKGLCYALDIPLISVDTLRSMASSIDIQDGYILPLLDARRMEVYAAVYDHQHKELKKTWAEIIQEESFREFMNGKALYLIGSGAEKCKDVLKSPDIKFNAEIIPTARTLAALSYEKYKAGEFENTAYFEPFYLKDFIIARPK